VHAVHVSVGGDDDLVVAQPVEPVLDIQRGLEEVKLFVFVDDFLGQAVGVERFAFEGEDRLRLHIARGGEGTGRGVTFDDEERALLGARVFVAEMQTAIAQLAIVERRLLRAFAGDVADAGQFLSLALVFLDLVADNFGRFAMLVQISIKGLLYKLADEFLDRRLYFARSQIIWFVAPAGVSITRSPAPNTYARTTSSPTCPGLMLALRW